MKPSFVSLEELQEHEHAVLDAGVDDTEGLSSTTRVDRYMELNYGRMGEDSEELAVRENRARKMLSL